MNAKKRVLLRSIVAAAIACAIAASGASCKDAIDGFPCTNDEQCNPPPCGPCEHGATITKQDMARECAVNPCTEPISAVCSSRRVCVVR